VYAIIDESGSQIKLSEGDVFEIDHRDGVEPGTDLTFDRVLLVGDESGGVKAKIGTPFVSGAKVMATVLRPTLGEKLDVIKFKRRKGYRRKIGHRQKYLTVEVTGIDG
jgi:large subunit ribosomal protein L21